MSDIRFALFDAYNKSENFLKEKAKETMMGFTLYTKRDYRVNWHNIHLCQKLDLFAQKKIKRLMIFMPPRHGKSEQGSRRLPAFIFGKNPTANIIATSYSSDLASRMNRDVQRIIDTPEYYQVFPESRLNSSNVATVSQNSWLRNSEMFEIVNFGGAYKCAGVGSGITGMGADYLLIDDPFKDMKEANSATIRNGVWDWYTSTAYTRLEKGGCVLLIMTRWHEDDLAGRLLEKAKKDPNADQWDVVSFEAIKDTKNNLDDPRKGGEALWPWKYSEENLASIKASSTARVWNALYQQRPSALEGNIINRSDINFYGGPTGVDLPERFRQQVHSWDFTFKKSDTADFVVGTVWGSYEGFWLLDCVRDRMGFNESLKAIKALIKKHPKYNSILIEAKANGEAIMDMIKKDVKKITPINPTDSKLARFEAVSPIFSEGDIWFPHPSIAPWVEGFIDELCTFPNGANDDRVDSTSQALNHLDKKSRSSLYKLSEL